MLCHLTDHLTKQKNCQKTAKAVIADPSSSKCMRKKAKGRGKVSVIVISDEEDGEEDEWESESHRK